MPSRVLGLPTAMSGTGMFYAHPGPKRMVPRDVGCNCEQALLWAPLKVSDNIESPHDPLVSYLYKQDTKMGNFLLPPFVEKPL